MFIFPSYQLNTFSGTTSCHGKEPAPGLTHHCSLVTLSLLCTEVWKRKCSHSLHSLRTFFNLQPWISHDCQGWVRLKWGAFGKQTWDVTRQWGKDCVGLPQGWRRIYPGVIYSSEREALFHWWRYFTWSRWNGTQPESVLFRINYSPQCAWKGAVKSLFFH